jgi:hypothetical protein
LVRGVRTRLPAAVLVTWERKRWMVLLGRYTAVTVRVSTWASRRNERRWRWRKRFVNAHTGKSVAIELSEGVVVVGTIQQVWHLCTYTLAGGRVGTKFRQPITDHLTVNQDHVVGREEACFGHGGVECII